MGDRTCTVPGCDRPHRCKGLCGPHYSRKRATGSVGTAQVQARGLSVPERFWARVDASGDCWIWTASCDFKGYGNFGGGEGFKSVRAHRWAYEHLVGSIPDGMVLDHLCRVRRCVNPDHLRVVTGRENTLCSPIAQAAIAARKTHCLRGHLFDEVNTWVGKGRNGRPFRLCRQCRRDRIQRERSARTQP